jgi:hypothetical protein
LEWLMNAAGHNVTVVPEGGVLFSKTEDPTHLRRFRSGELANICRQVGFTVEALFFDAHATVTIARRIEGVVGSRVNLRRRSERLDDAFVWAVDALARCDWLLFRHLPAGTSMICFLRKLS